MLRKHIAVDLGTANTLVFVQSQGIVINEPSVVAVDTINERVIAVGKEAKDYIGKTPQRISTIRPLRDGVIADFDAAQALIATFLKKVIGSWPIKPDVVICVPTNITDVERRAVAEKGGKGSSSDSDDDSGSRDPMFEQAVECVIEAGQASTSLLQRRCKLGYARAARIMDQMEQEKIIGPYEGAKPRAVLLTRAQWQERQLGQGE